MIVVPEKIIYRVLKAGFAAIQKEMAGATDIKKTWIYNVLAGRHDFGAQAVNVPDPQDTYSPDDSSGRPPYSEGALPTTANTVETDPQEQPWVERAYFLFLGDPNDKARSYMGVDVVMGWNIQRTLTLKANVYVDFENSTTRPSIGGGFSSAEYFEMAGGFEAPAVYTLAEGNLRIIVQSPNYEEVAIMQAVVRALLLVYNSYISADHGMHIDEISTSNLGFDPENNRALYFKDVTIKYKYDSAVPTGQAFPVISEIIEKVKLMQND